MSEFPVIYNLPADHEREIGRIMIRWAHLEWKFKHTCYLLLGVGPKEGRLTVREPRSGGAIVVSPAKVTVEVTTAEGRIEHPSLRKASTHG